MKRYTLSLFNCLLVAAITSLSMLSVDSDFNIRAAVLAGTLTGLIQMKDTLNKQPPRLLSFI